MPRIAGPVRFLRRVCALLLCALAALGAAPVSTMPGTQDQPEPAKEPESKKEGGAPAAAPAAPEKPADAVEWYSIHAQSTFVGQANSPMHSPYASFLSFPSTMTSRNTATGTLYFDLRLWHGADVVFDPEFAGGTGLNGTSGIAGFPNGEATRTGLLMPTGYVARLFLRQTIGLNGDLERVESGPNQLAGYRDIDRITFTIGKMSATDIFDDNRFSHDPRTQFMNWSIMYNGAWDYPANTRGYNYGGTVEFNTRYFAFRYGLFGEPSAPNGPDIDPKILRAHGQIWEIEERYELDGHPGRLHQFAYLNYERAANYRQVLVAMPVNPDPAPFRAYQPKYGFGMNFEQELTRDLGAFLRAGWNDGQTENWAFTEIDETISAGLLLKGTRWRRPKDEAGIAGVFNGISNAHRDFLAAGGFGFIIGDGRLNYGPEEIVELYYNCELRDGLNLTLDFQGVNHPAYNRDRGPVAVWGLRVHLAF